MYSTLFKMDFKFIALLILIGSFMVSKPINAMFLFLQGSVLTCDNLKLHDFRLFLLNVLLYAIMCANYRIHLLLYCVILLSKSCFFPVKSKPDATVTFHEVLSLSISRQWRVWTKTWPCVNPDLQIFVSNVTNSGAPGCVHLKKLTVGWIFGAFHHAPRSLPWGSESNIINIEKLNRYSRSHKG